MQESTKGGWTSQGGYIWAMLGSAVGFANILSFSAQCYKNGGGAFLIPSLFAYLILGVPLLILEGLLGQRSQKPYVAAYRQDLGRIGSSIAWISIITCIMIGSFYIVLTGYSLAYTYFAASNSIPTDTAYFFKHHFLQDSGSITNFGNLSISVLFSTLSVVLLVGWVQIKNIQSGIEKVCSFAMPLLAVMIFIFVGITIFLPGASEGIRYYLTPDFSRLMDFNLWRDIFGQLFFSLSLGLGIVTGYSRYNGSNINLARAMGLVALGDLIISATAGLVIFACLGFLSQNNHTPFTELVQTDSIFEIGFIIFPLVIQTIPSILGNIVGAIFFLCLFIAGITGVFSIIESIAGNIEVEFKQTRRAAVIYALSIVALISLNFCMGNGLHILAALEPMVLGFLMLFAGIAETGIFLFVHRHFFADFAKTLSILPFSVINALRYTILGILLSIFFGAVQTEILSWNSSWLAHCLRWSWLVLTIILAIGLARWTPKMNTSKQI